MSKIIFPPEIIERTVEVYHTQISTKSKAIYWIILIFILIVFAILPIVKVDVSRQSRGLVRTPFENAIIQTSVSGEIIDTRMFENMQVTKGDTLLILKTSSLSEQQILYESKINENNQFVADLDRLIKGEMPTLTSKYISEYNRFIARRLEFSTQVNYFKKQLDIDTELKEKNVIAEYEYDKTKNSYENAMEQLNSLAKEYTSNWQAEKTVLLQKNREMASTIMQIDKEKELYTITASTNGVLLQVAGFNTGNFISPTQQLAVISTSDSLIAECYIAPADIGYIKVGQDVNFQFDTYNYREWGAIKGKVSEIIYDVIISNEQPMFRVRCALDDNMLYLSNGYSGQIQKGMSFTAHFYITRRTLWQMLFDKLDNWLNPKNFTNS